MRSLNQYILEYLPISKLDKAPQYKYHPENNFQLHDYIKKELEIQGPKADLNCIDTSDITNMSYVFNKIDFDGDISKWDVSNVTDMFAMFRDSTFSGKVNGGISNWDVSNVKNVSNMFSGSKFDGDLSKWKLPEDCNIGMGVFLNCPLYDKPKPKWFMDWYHKNILKDI